MTYHMDTVDDARRSRTQVWVDCINRVIDQATMYRVLADLRALWGAEIYRR